MAGSAGRPLTTNVEAYAAWERLSGGCPLLIRAIGPADKEALQAMVRRLSPESAYLRFFQAKRELSLEELSYYTEVDFQSHVALVAIFREDDADLLIGTGRYFRGESTAPDSAELSFLVDDAHQGQGVATHLLRHLAAIAWAAGISELRAEVLADNKRMLDVFSHSGLPMEVVPAGPMARVRLALKDPSEM